MNATIKNIFIIVIACIGAGFLLLFSVVFSTGYATPTENADDDKKWYTALIQTPGDSATIKQTLIDPKKQKIAKNTPIIANFGRLVSYLYLAKDGTQDTILTQSGTDVTVSADAGIVSLYDLFVHYTIHSDRGSFKLEQITNGSFYIGHESDGKISIYSIDGVARLTFLDKGADMTNMVLFPGSYIHFDPTRNASLKDADLFRIITTLDVDNNEVFEFVNPRVNIGDDKDIFFNYRLPAEAKSLFQVLSASFRAHVQNIDIIKEYGKSAAYTKQDQSSLLYNPSKKNHQMLLELSGLLSQAVDPNANLSDLVGKIGTIYNNAKGLNLEGATAKKTIEQFLLDGRFALYSGSTKTRYQEIYESIAKLIGIQVDNGNSKLLQNLSNIYSQNLFNQKRTDATNTIKIDTYTQTATELIRTLDQDSIAQKDYFDIAIYAYNILGKTQISPGLISLDTVKDPATYDLMSTFLYAANKYITSVEDGDLKNRTITGFTSKFYDPMITTLSHSIYKHLTIVDAGSLFLAPAYISGPNANLGEDLPGNIERLNTILLNIAPSIQDIFFQNPSAGEVGIRLKKEILRLKGFEKMSRPEGYKDYVKAPFAVDITEEIPLPSITPTLDAIEFSAPQKKPTPSVSELSSDPRIQKLREIFPNIENTSIILTDNGVNIVDVPVQIGRSGGKSSNVTLSATLDGLTALKNMNLNYGAKKLAILTDSMSLSVYAGFVGELQYYLDTIDKIDPDGTSSDPVRIMPVQKRISIGNNIYSVATGR